MYFFKISFSFFFLIWADTQWNISFQVYNVVIYSFICYVVFATNIATICPTTSLL